MLDLFGEELTETRKKNRDYIGSRLSVVKTIGASNHSLTERQPEEYYATPPYAVEKLLELETFSHNILEPSCGGGHVSRVLEGHGHNVISIDLYDRGYGIPGIDFLNQKECARVFEEPLDCDIVGNPPYKYAQEFVERGLEVVGDGHKCAWFLKLTFLEGKARRTLFDRCCLEKVYVSSSRLGCGKNGTEWNPSAVCYAWFIWKKGFQGDPIIKWFN